jgi:signal transduction histidine kinase
LHDDITQRIARLAIDTSHLDSERDQAARTATIREVRDELVRLSDDVHSLAYKLHPALLERLGLANALKSECERFSRQESINVSMKLGKVPANIPQDIALCFLRVTQEALRNVARHAKAATAEVGLREVNTGLELVVRDSGVGFNAATASQGLGLASMRERVRLLGGDLNISSEVGKGTTVLVWLSLQELVGHSNHTDTWQPDSAEESRIESEDKSHETGSSAAG